MVRFSERACEFEAGRRPVCARLRRFALKNHKNWQAELNTAGHARKYGDADDPEVVTADLVTLGRVIPARVIRDLRGTGRVGHESARANRRENKLAETARFHGKSLP